MIILGDIETVLHDCGKDVPVQLTVVECQCGFHQGMDFTYLEQVKDLTWPCPSCGVLLRLDSV